MVWWAKLVANAGRESAMIGDHVIMARGGEGHNVSTADLEDLIASGAVDPTNVPRTALQNSASIAGLLLTTGCLITDLPEPLAAGVPPKSLA